MLARRPPRVGGGTFSRVANSQSKTQDSWRSRMAADSTMLRTRNRFTALSLGTMEPEDSQNTRLTCWDERGMAVSVVRGRASIGFIPRP